MEMAAMMGISAAYSWGKEIFDYNRANYQFDQSQMLKREIMRIEMQIKRFELFRHDVRDLVKLTVDRMDTYHVIGALFLKFIVVFLTKGRIQAAAPPFLISLFMLSNATAFIYLLLAVWMSMHASIASHSFGTRMLTRFVRLPIPSAKQLRNLTFRLLEFEQQGLSNVLRLPFQEKSNKWSHEVIQELERDGAMYFADNSKLCAETDGMAIRSTKDLNDWSGGQIAWGDTFLGIDEGDGWIRLANGYLPEFVRDIPVVRLHKAGAHRKPPPRKEEKTERAKTNEKSPHVTFMRGSTSIPDGAESSAVPGTSFLEPGEKPARSASADPRAGGAPSSVARRLKKSAGKLKRSVSRKIRRRKGAKGQLLAEDDEEPIGGDDLLSGPGTLKPERHVELFRHLQSKWQCYDAYCRVCMGLGVNQILQSLSYYSIAHTLVENNSPSLGFFLCVMFQCCTVSLGRMDLAGLNPQEIVFIQVLGMVPCFVTTISISRATRNSEGAIDPNEQYPFSPFSFCFMVLWLEMWLRVSAPSRDEARLPRRFRQVLFLDVFGDAKGWDPTQAQFGTIPDDVLKGAWNFNDPDEDANEVSAACAELGSIMRHASSQLMMAQSALRRWNAVPPWCPSAAQRRELNVLVGRLNNWGHTVHTELERCRKIRGMAELPPSVFESELRQWTELTDAEKLDDPFNSCLLGPFEHDGTEPYYFNLEGMTTVFENNINTVAPGALVLSLQAVGAILKDLEMDSRAALEARIVHDLKAQTHLRRRLQQQREAEAAVLPLPTLDPAEEFAGLLSLAAEPQGITRLLNSISRGPEEAPQDAAPALGTESVDSGEEGPSDADTSDSEAPLEPEDDVTLKAMAGQNARQFVPQRLPWLIVSRLSRAIQLCWLFTMAMALLKELNVYEVDFGLILEELEEAGGELGGFPGVSNKSGEGRRLLHVGADDWTFEQLDVQWPHGRFFRPLTLLCSSRPGDGEMHIASPFALYSVSRPDSLPWGLTDVSDMRLAPSTALLCEHTDAEDRPGPGPLPAGCLLAVPEARGLSIWPARPSGNASERVTLPWEDKPWRAVAGGVLRCGELGGLVPASEADAAARCLVLAGWDGTAVPIAALALPSGSGGLGALAGAPVQVRALAPVLAQDGAEDSSVALWLHARSGRLLASSSGGQLGAWDLPASRRLGRWRLPPLSGAPGARQLGLCEDSAGDVFVLQWSAAGGPRLLRSPLPGGAPGGAGPGAQREPEAGL